MDSQMIDGNEFFLKLEAPVRQEVKAHECVCLLIKHEAYTPETIKHMRRAGEAAGVPGEILESIIGNQDKCHRMVDNPDQPFCDGCEDAEHHLLPNQMGGARHIHRNNKEI